MMNVFIYVDDGSSFEDLLRELARELDHSVGRLIPLLAEDVVDGAVLTGVGTLVMPGGADLPYRAKLDGSGNARIRRFVEEGGTYLGVCAGAYYGCRSLAFHEGRNDEVSGSRELAFVDAQAVGSLPELGPLYDLTIRSASSARLEWEGQGTFRGYYHGGPRFEMDGGAAHVFARFVDVVRAPAGLERVVGAGKAVLVGVHVEMTPELLASKLAHLTDGGAYRHLVELLKDGERSRRAAFRDLLRRAAIPLKPGPA